MLIMQKAIETNRLATYERKIWATPRHHLKVCGSMGPATSLGDKDSPFSLWSDETDRYGRSSNAVKTVFLFQGCGVILEVKTPIRLQVLHDGNDGKSQCSSMRWVVLLSGRWWDGAITILVKWTPRSIATTRIQGEAVGCPILNVT